MQFITEEYLLLFNAITDAEKALAQLRSSLMDAQLRAEELYLRRAGDSPAADGQERDP